VSGKRLYLFVFNRWGRSEYHLKEWPMKRLAMGCIWFFVLWIGMRMLGGAIAGAMAGGNAGSYDAGYQSGYQAGQAFNQQYGLAILIAALFIAVISTIRGWLPGTKARSSNT
jgi:hypothetical protein